LKNAKSEITLNQEQQETNSFMNRIVRAYVEGFCWVLSYYYQGVPSWKWYYPYHYAPFASDFVDIGALKIEFELSEPFKPVEQLMGVLPAARSVCYFHHFILRILTITYSNKHIPAPFRQLMEDEESPIIDFYPRDFKIDMNGKKAAWQGVSLLPFIDASRLLSAMQPIYPTLSAEDIELNQLSTERLFVGHKHKLFEPFCGLYAKKLDKAVKLAGAISGWVSLDNQVTIPGCMFHTPFEELNARFTDLPDTKSISVMFSLVDINTGEKRPPRFEGVLLPGVKLPPKMLSREDVDRIRMPDRHGDRVSGYTYGNRGPGGGGRRGGYQGNNYQSNHYQSSPRGGYNNQRGGSGYRGNSPHGYQNQSFPPRRHSPHTEGYNSSYQGRGQAPYHQNQSSRSYSPPGGGYQPDYHSTYGTSPSGGGRPSHYSGGGGYRGRGGPRGGYGNQTYIRGGRGDSMSKDEFGRDVRR
jgi:5'-3' exoribonuclease 2